MKKVGLVLIGIVVLTIGILSIPKEEKQVLIEEKEELSNTSLAFYIEKEEGGYEETSSLPQTGYTLNTERSICTNNTTPIWKDNKLYLNNLSSDGTSCYLYFDEYNAMIAEDAILTYAARGSGTPNFANTSCSNGTNNGNDCEEATVGLYEGTENGEMIYYFRGDVDDNWVSFAGFYWRIIRTNSDGSIRMIYAGTDPNVTTGTGTQISLDGSTTTYQFNSSRDASYYVGLKYSTSQHGTTTDSNIMETLNTWYENNLTGYASYLTSGTGFCNDREMTSGSSWSATPSSDISYIAYERIYTTRTSTLDCTNSYDNFTTSEAGIGNGTLSNPIGLITADEVARAGGKGGTPNYGYYLYTGQNYWTMSPCNFDATNSYASVFYVISNGNLISSSVNGARGVRPVINLRADVTLTGSGTSSDPYVVEGVA